MSRIKQLAHRGATVASLVVAGLVMPAQALAQPFIWFPDADPSSSRFRGVRIFDISDLDNPVQTTRATVLLLSTQRLPGEGDAPCTFDGKVVTESVAEDGTVAAMGERRFKLSDEESPRARVVLPATQMGPLQTLGLTHGVVVERANGPCQLLVGGISFDTLTGSTERLLEQFTIGPPFEGARSAATERPLSFVGGTAGERIRVLLTRQHLSAGPPCSLTGDVVLHHVPPMAPEGSGPYRLSDLDLRYPIHWRGDVAVVDIPLDVPAAVSGGRAEALLTLALDEQVRSLCMDGLAGAVAIVDDVGRVKVQFTWDRVGKMDRVYFLYSHFDNAGR